MNSLARQISCAGRNRKVLRTRRSSSTGTKTTADTSGRWHLSTKGPLISAGILGGVVSGAVGAYLWRFRWCENQLHAFAVNDMDGGDSPSIDVRLEAYQHSRCTPQTEKDAEALRQILNTPPKGITFVESSTDRLAEHFVYTALAPRPCVIYISLDKCMVDNPDMLIKYVAEKFGVYVVFAFYAMREKLFLGPPTDAVLLRSLRSVLDIVDGSLSRLKSEYTHNYFPPVVVMSGAGYRANCEDDTSGTASNSSRLMAKYFLSFCREMSLKGLLHVVIPQRSGTTMLPNKNFNSARALRSSGHIFIPRPMDAQESLIYLYSNIFTTHSSIPGDLIRRLKITERGDKLRLKQSQLWDDFRAQNPSQTSILTAVADLIHENEDMLDKYIELVLSHAIAKAKAKSSAVNQSRAENVEILINKLEPVGLDVTDVVTPQILFSAYRQLLREQYQSLSSAVLSTFLCDDDHINIALVSKEECEAVSKTLLNITSDMSSAHVEAAIGAPAVHEDDIKPGSAEGEGVCHSSYQPSVAQSAGVSPEDYYDHLFDAGTHPIESPGTDEKNVSERTAKKATAIAGGDITRASSAPPQAQSPQLQRIYEVARKRLKNRVESSGTPRISAIDIENAKLLDKKDRESALKSVSNAIVALTQAPQFSANRRANQECTAGIVEKDITIWRFVHDYLRGEWGTLWYLLDKKIVTLGLPQKSNHSVTSSQTLNRDAVLVSQSAAVHQYVVQFSTPLQRRIAESFIFDGGCEVKDELGASFSRGSVPQPLKYKKHKPLANKRSSINVVGYGSGDVEHADESVIENFSDPRTEADSFGVPVTFGSLKDSFKKTGVSRNFEYLTPALGSCDTFEKSDVLSNILYGSALTNCNAKLDALFDYELMHPKGGVMQSLGESQRSLVRACAVKMNLCDVSESSSSTTDIGCDQLADEYLRSVRDGVKKRVVSGVNNNALLAAYHLERIASIHGAIDVHAIQETLAIQGYLHNRSRIELALDMLYLESKAVVPLDLVLLLDTLEVEEMVQLKE